MSKDVDLVKHKSAKLLWCMLHETQRQLSILAINFKYKQSEQAVRASSQSKLSEQAVRAVNVLALVYYN